MPKRVSVHDIPEKACMLDICSMQLMRDTSYRNPQTDAPLGGCSKKKKKLSELEPCGFNATALQIKMLLNLSCGQTQRALQPQILLRSLGIEPTRLNVRRYFHFVFENIDRGVSA